MQAAQAATSTIPILYPNISDPVADHVADSIDHPGHNITGVSAELTQNSPQRLQLLKDLVGDKLHRVYVVFNPAFAVSVRSVALLRTKAQELGLELVERNITTRADVQAAMDKLGSENVDGLVMTPDTFVMANADLVMNAVAQNKLPAIGVHDWNADWGMLASLGTFPDRAVDSLADLVVEIKGAPRRATSPSRSRRLRPSSTHARRSACSISRSRTRS